MKNLLNRFKSANLKEKNRAIALILVLTISAAAAIWPHVNAQTNINTYSSTPTVGSNGLYNFPSFAGLTIAPSPVGVGQTAQVIMLIELLPPSVGIEAVTGVTGGWLGLTLTVTDPNGTSTTMGPYETDVSGTYQIGYTPDTVGTYTFVMNFPGQTVNGTGYMFYHANFQASTSRTVSLVVQQAPVSGYSEAPVPLPTQYWSEPVNAQNRYWSTIEGPWLQTGYNATGAYNPYTYAPDSAHIAWKTQNYAMTEGLAGGALGSLQSPGTENSGSFNVGFSTPIIMEGRMYYNGPIMPLANGTEQYYMDCADLATGKVLWQVPLYAAPGQAIPTATITCGQILDWRTQQMHSALPYIWQISNGLYSMYSAVNGELQAQWHNLPAGATVANSTTVALVFGGVNFTPTTITSPVTVLAGTTVLEQPNPTVVGQGIGGGVGGGALLEYILGSNGVGKTCWLACWNSTLAIDSIDNDVVDWPLGASQGGFDAGIGIAAAAYFPTIALQQTTMPLDWNWGIMWNLTFPNPGYVSKTGNPAGADVPATWAIAGADGNYVILQSSVSDAVPYGSTSASGAGTAYRTLAAINVANQPMTTQLATSTVISTQGAPYQIGGDTPVTTPATFAWIENYTVPAYDQGAGTAGLRNGGNIIITDTTLESVWDFSETTGALLWTSTPFNNDFVMQSMTVGVVANGMYYQAGYDGYMHAINTTTGVQMWDSPSITGGLEMPQPYYPMSGVTVADGKVYTTTLKSYEQQPLFRGHELLCYDANTGAALWNISGQIPVAAIAEGYLIGVNAYDGCVYCFNRGPTATTVSTPQTEITAGSSVIIQGTVTDQTPGIAQGTPAISDAWMTPWMEYLYMDQPYPSQATGVPVSIDAIDPNGNFIHIGSATSDISGTYIYTWTPPDVPGQYRIIATFSADNSYYGSSGETGAVVVSAASTPASPTPTPTSVADMYFVPAIAGIIVLIIIVAIVLALLVLRKRP